MTILLAFIAGLFVYHCMQNRAQLRTREREIQMFRKTLCKGDTIRLGSGHVVEIAFAGDHDLYFYINERLHRVSRREVLPIIQN